MLNSVFFIVAIRTAVPLILASVGCSYTIKVGILNLGLEGMMLMSAFFAAAGAYWGYSPLTGMALGIFASLVIAVIFGILTINLGANPIMTGVAINLVAQGLSIVLLELLFGIRGNLQSERIVSFSPLTTPWLEGIPVIGPVLASFDAVTYMMIILVVIAIIVLNHTPLGLRIRAIGEHPSAAASAGINLNLYRHLASLICGLFCGIAGSYLVLGGLSLFSENMTAGKGFIALTAALFASGSPSMAILASLVFGLAEALTMKIQRFAIASHFALMTPYVLTLVLLLFRRIRDGRLRVLADS
jgi:general nucleoside transport system permease protein